LWTYTVLPGPEADMLMSGSCSPSIGWLQRAQIIAGHPRALRGGPLTMRGGGGPPRGEISEDPAAAKLCADAFEAVWARAVPHENYKIT
jgi:hypothetical protein